MSSIMISITNPSTRNANTNNRNNANNANSKNTTNTIHSDGAEIRVDHSEDEFNHLESHDEAAFDGAEG